ncbi:MAG TPA: hypothetical protein VMU63_11060, partial [Acidimicrobiales bacterium]|nr:hypothetical protein [Acidimicrobiales bacterium]
MFLLGLATVVAAPFSAATASASAKGTVKINGTDIGIANDPNVDCPVTVSFFNFDDFTGGISSYTGNATFTAVPPTSHVAGYVGVPVSKSATWTTPASPDATITPTGTDYGHLFDGLSNS